MSKIIKIGAPSLTGIDSNDVVNELFTGATFPLKMRLHNHLPRNIVFPEIGVFMKPLGGSAEAVIQSFDELHRVVSSIEQIAELNQHELAITIEEIADEKPVSGAGAKAQAKSAPAELSTGV